jgi:aminoglycoside phosphotransferase (APT) family kinase protein
MTRRRPSGRQKHSNNMATSAVPTPVVLAVDPDGTEVGAPALLMTVLEGRPRWDAKGRRHWAHELAELAAAIHDHRPDDPTAFRSFATYRQDSYEPPRWATDLAIWEPAMTIFHGPVPAGTAFVHRDFHPGNILWQRRNLTGVVDWESSRIGPPDIDIGHCRVNLLYETPDLAAHLADAWLDVTGNAYNPWADIATIIGLLDSLRASPPSPSARWNLESVLAAAVATLGG